MSENLPEGVDAERRQHTFDDATMPALIAGLAASAGQLSNVAADLYRASILSRVERVIAIVLVLGMAILMTVMGYGVLRLNNIAEVNQTNGDYVRECTTPGTEEDPHLCFDESQSRTAALIANLNATTLATIICAERFDGDAISRCVQEELRR